MRLCCVGIPVDRIWAPHRSGKPVMQIGLFIEDGQVRHLTMIPAPAVPSEQQWSGERGIIILGNLKPNNFISITQCGFQRVDDDDLREETG